MTSDARCGLRHRPQGFVHDGLRTGQTSSSYRYGRSPHREDRLVGLEAAVTDQEADEVSFLQRELAAPRWVCSMIVVPTAAHLFPMAGWKSEGSPAPTTAGFMIQKEIVWKLRLNLATVSFT